MASEREREEKSRGRREKKERERDGEYYNRFPNFSVSQNLSAFSLHFQMTIVKKKKKIIKNLDWLYCSSVEKRPELLKAIFKESYLKFWQSWEPNYYMSFFFFLNVNEKAVKESKRKESPLFPGFESPPAAAWHSSPFPFSFAWLYFALRKVSFPLPAPSESLKGCIQTTGRLIDR